MKNAKITIIQWSDSGEDWYKDRVGESFDATVTEYGCFAHSDEVIEKRLQKGLLNAEYLWVSSDDYVVVDTLKQGV